MRKSIFEIANERIDIARDINRIIHLFEVEKTLCVGFNNMSLYEYVSEFCFSEWKHKGHSINLDDFLSSLGYNSIKILATNDNESLLTLIEIVYNCWNLANQQSFSKGLRIHYRNEYHHLKDIMDDILNIFNHTTYLNKDRDCVLVVESNAAVTAVAEIVPSTLSFNITKYNHKSLQGKIDEKKRILLSLGTELEPKRKELEKLNKKLSNNIFFVLNTCDIRHNNHSENDLSKYNEYIAKMPDEQLEEHYDDLYQMMLLAFLLLDNEDRQTRIDELKSKQSNNNN